MKAKARVIAIILLMLILSPLTLANVNTIKADIGTNDDIPTDNSSPYWNHIYETDGRDLLFSVVKTRDGGYAAVGYTNSTGTEDIMILKTDALGNKLWSKTFGGTGLDLAASILETAEGDFVLSGVTNSFSNFDFDAYLIKTDCDGNLLWQKTYGGPGSDSLFGLSQDTEGAFLLAGSSNSSACLIKTDSSGNLLWQKFYQGTGSNSSYFTKLIVDDESNYVIVGFNTTYYPTLLMSNTDVFLVKTNKSGDLLYQKSYGGIGLEYGYGLIETKSGRYAICGYTSNGSSGGYDIYAIETDVDGNILWSKTYGQSSDDKAYSLLENSKDELIITGSYTQPNQHFPDVVLYKLDSSGNYINHKTYGADGTDIGRCVIQNNDGTYIIGAFSNSFNSDSHFWLIKTQLEEYDGAFLVVRGLDNGIYYRIFNSTSSNWSIWHSLPGQTVDSPAATACGNELHLVVRSADGLNLYHGYLSISDNTFSGWTLISGSTPSAPTLTSNGTALTLVVRGQNNMVYYRIYTIATHTWRDWQVVPNGSTDDKVAAIMIGNQLILAVKGNIATSVWNNSINLDTGAFLGWVSVLGVPTNSAPSLAYYPELDRYFLVVRGQDNSINIKWYTGSSGQGWFVLSNWSSSGSLAAAVIGDKLFFVTRGEFNEMVWESSNDSNLSGFSGRHLIDGMTPSTPVLVRSDFLNVDSV